MVSVRGILSHGGLRKDNPDIKGITGFYRSPGIAGTLQETSLSPTPRTSPWSASAFVGYLCTVVPTLLLRALAMYAAFPRSDSSAPFDCLWGLGVSSGFPHAYSPPSLTSLAGSPVFTVEDSKRNAVGGVFLLAPSTLCGSPDTPWGRSGLPMSSPAVF